MCALLLGIETSCDETAAAVMDDSGAVKSNIVLSQDEIHAPYGGIVPELASRQHIMSIGYVISESLKRAKKSLKNIDVYAVTLGPGLVGSLLVGVSYAKALAYYFGKPLVEVDHLEAHVHSVFIENEKIAFPALALLVSGGHTSLFLLRKRLKIEPIASTRDDAAGEALDKIAKHLDLGYPGGPVIDKLAEKGDPHAFPFSLPRMRDRSLDYSFSGLKTAALKYIREKKISTSSPGLNDFVASFEKAVIRALLNNLADSVDRTSPRSLILCGGVARNTKLRRSFLDFASERKLASYVPSPEYCTDNAAMIASLGLEKFKKGQAKTSFLDLNAYPRRRD
jgi:N6-L-threonylcarbamoyladenine synthase